MHIGILTLVLVLGVVRCSCRVELICIELRGLLELELVLASAETRLVVKLLKADLSTGHFVEHYLI